MSDNYNMLKLQKIKSLLEEYEAHPTLTKWTEVITEILGHDHKAYKRQKAAQGSRADDAMQVDTEDTEVTDESSQGDDAPKAIEPQLALIVVPQPDSPVIPVAKHILMNGNWLTVDDGHEFLLAMDNDQLQKRQSDLRKIIAKLHPDSKGGDQVAFQQASEQYEKFEEVVNALKDPLDRARRIRGIAGIGKELFYDCWRFLTAKQLRGVLLEETNHDKEHLQTLSHEELVRLCQTPVVAPEEAAENDKKKEAKTRYGRFLRKKFKRFQKRWINANATQQLTHFAIKQRKRVHALKKKVQIEELLAASLNLQKRYARRGIRELRPGTLKVLTKLFSAPLELKLGKGCGGITAYWRLE